MPLDVSTLMFAGGFVTFSSSVFLLVVWWQDRSAWPAFWWAMASGAHGVGVMLISVDGKVPFYVSAIIAPSLLNVAAVLVFVAARIFNSGSTNRVVPIVAAVIWTAIQLFIGASWGEQFASALGMGMSGVLYAAAAFEFWRTRSEQIRGRWPMIFVLGMFASALLMMAVQTASLTSQQAMQPIGWLGSIHIVGLFYALGVTVFLSVMLKDRTEAKYRQAALVDPLTELANRRGFLDRAQRVFRRQAHDTTPVAVIAFDLDYFKRVNDTFGHAMGDRVLCSFAAVLSGTMRPLDIAARIGGEEFAAILHGADDQAAVLIANRIRSMFQSTALFVDGQRIEATVSVGVCVCAGRSCNVIDMLAKADAALYEAKNAGRNRVILAGNVPGTMPLAKVVRIA